MNEPKPINPQVVVLSVEDLKSIVMDATLEALKKNSGPMIVLPQMDQEPIEEEEFLTREEVAKKFGVTTVTLWRWDQEKILPATKVGRKVFYPMSTVREFIERNKGRFK